MSQLSQPPAARNFDASSQPDADDRQDLPVPSPFSLPAWRRFAVGTGVSIVKSAEIATRGARVCGAAMFALAATATDDAFAQQRSRLSCRTLATLLDLERDYTLRAIAENARRIGLVAGIAWQVGADATYPVQRQLGRTLEILGLAGLA